MHQISCALSSRTSCYVVFLAVFLAGVPCDDGVVESGRWRRKKKKKKRRGALFVAARREKDFSRWEKISDDGDDQRV